MSHVIEFKVGQADLFSRLLERESIPVGYFFVQY